MKKITTFLLISFMIFSTNLFSTERKSIAIADFNESGVQIKGQNDLIRAKVESLITDLGRLTMVERSKLDSLLKEQSLGASGLVDDATAAKIGGLLGVNYLLFGDIVQGNITGPVHKTRQNTKTVKKKQPNGTYKYYKVNTTFEEWEELTGSSSISIKIVDVNTGAIKYSKTYTQRKVKKINSKTYKNKSQYLKLKRNNSSINLITKLLEANGTIKAQDLSDEYRQLLTDTLQANVYRFRKDMYFEFPLEGIIIQIRDKKTVVIDIGSEQGASMKTKFEVIRIGTPIKHPTTGQLMENKQKLNGKLKIIEVQANTCVCKGSKSFISSLKVGDIVISRSRGIIR